MSDGFKQQGALYVPDSDDKQRDERRAKLKERAQWASKTAIEAGLFDSEDATAMLAVELMRQGAITGR